MGDRQLNGRSLTGQEYRGLGAQLEVKMEGTRTWIIALVALIVGAGIGYVYMQGQASGLAEPVSTLETQLAEAGEKAQSAASEIEALKADRDEKTKLIEQQQARITELEAASQETTLPTPQ